MAYDEALISWLGKNSNKYELEVARYTWIEEWLPGLHDVAARITFRGRKYEGRGTARALSTALEKAVAEAFERAVFRSCTDLENTSGLAVHTDRLLAEDAARCELLERDSFFCHYLTKRPFAPLNLRDFVNRTQAKAIERRTKATGTSLLLGEMITASDERAAICVMMGLNATAPFGARIGLGCHTSLQLAVKHAVIEAVRSSISLVTGHLMPEPLDLTSFNSLTTVTVKDHDRLGLSLSSLPVISSLFGLSESASIPASNAFPPTMELEPINLPNEMRGCPLYPVIAKSSDLQCAYFGHMKDHHINLTRLSQFAGYDLTPEDLQSYPHFLG